MKNEIELKMKLKIKNKEYMLFYIFNKEKKTLNLFDNYELLFNKKLYSKNDNIYIQLFYDKNKNKLYYNFYDKIKYIDKRFLNKCISSIFFREFSYSLSYMIISSYRKELDNFYQKIFEYMKK